MITISLSELQESLVVGQARHQGWNRMNVHILASCHRKDYVLRFSISVFLSAKKTRTEMRMKENEREKKRETERERVVDA